MADAGIISGRRLLDIPDERIETVFSVNVLALYWVTKAFLPEMIERNSGHIVTMASAAGLLGRQDHHRRAVLRGPGHDGGREVAVPAPPTDP